MQSCSLKKYMLKIHEDLYFHCIILKCVFNALSWLSDLKPFSNSRVACLRCYSTIVVAVSRHFDVSVHSPTGSPAVKKKEYDKL